MARPPVVIASPQTFVAEGIAGILRNAGYLVRGLCTSAESLSQALATEGPSLVLLDAAMCGPEFSVIRGLASRGHTVVVVVAPGGVCPPVLKMMQAGAHGCLSLEGADGWFAASLDLMLRGFLVMSGVPCDSCPRRLPGLSHEDRTSTLTPREKQLAALVARGARNREIARELSISENTVRAHLSHVLSKLDLRNRQQLAAYMTRCSFVADPERRLHEQEAPSPSRSAGRALLIPRSFLARSPVAVE